MAESDRAEVTNSEAPLERLAQRAQRDVIEVIRALTDRRGTEAFRILTTLRDALMIRDADYKP